MSRTEAGSHPPCHPEPELPELPEGLRNRFRIGSRLGSGAYGEVFRAREASSGREVALKILRAGANSEAVERFLREGRLASKIRSPRVAELFAHGIEGEIRYLAMRLVPGSDLERYRLAHGGRIEPGEGVRIFLDLLEGLAAIHAAGIVHRDLKPRNVLMEAGRPVIADFGLAHGVDETTLTRTGQVVGTPLYMPAEQMEGGSAAPLWDLYAAGVILVELVGGEPPFGNDTYQNVYARKCAGLRLPLPGPSPVLAEPLPGILSDLLGPREERSPWTATSLLQAVRAGPQPASGRTGARQRPGSPPGPMVGSAIPAPASGPAPRGRTGLLRVAAPSVILALGLAVGLFLPETHPEVGPTAASPVDPGGSASGPAGEEVRPVASDPGGDEPGPGAASGEGDEAPGRVLAAQLGALLDDSEFAPVLALAERDDSSYALQVFRVARAAWRRRATAMTQALARLPEGIPSRSDYRTLVELSTLERLLEHHRQRGEEPLYPPGGPRPPLSAWLATGLGIQTVTLDPKPEGTRAETWSATYRTLLAGFPGTWTNLPLPRGSTLLRIQNPAGEGFADPAARLPKVALAIRNEVGPTLEDAPLEIEIPLEPSTGDLELCLVVYDWEETSCLRLDVLGRDQTAPFVASVHSSGDQAGDSESFTRLAVFLRIPASLIPEAARRARLTAIGLQPIGDPSVTVNLAACFQRTGR